MTSQMQVAMETEIHCDVNEMKEDYKIIEEEKES